MGQDSNNIDRNEANTQAFANLSTREKLHLAQMVIRQMRFLGVSPEVAIEDLVRIRQLPPERAKWAALAYANRYTIELPIFLNGEIQTPVGKVVIEDVTQFLPPLIDSGLFRIEVSGSWEAGNRTLTLISLYPLENKKSSNSL